MATPSLQDQLNMKAELDRSKNADLNQSDDTGTETPVPTWMTASAGSIQTKALMADFNKLLEQLPLIQNSDSEDIRGSYFQELVSQLTQIYYFRFKIIEDSGTTTREQVQDEFDQTLAQIAKVLNIQ